MVRELVLRWLECAANCGGLEATSLLLTLQVPRWPQRALAFRRSKNVKHAFEQL
jgi:hypothetical protein